MRLMNVDTLELELFHSSNDVHGYAILSHTWGADEVMFQDWQDGSVRKRKRESYEKIRSACREARMDGLGYVWVDTNCIDKTGSAELSEAINSMFAWYRDSAVCYAYLADVSYSTLEKHRLPGLVGH